MSMKTDYANSILFDPTGKIQQLGFIKNTVSFGNTVVALRNNNYGIIISLNTKASKYAHHQKKVFSINDNTLFTFSGITNDGTKIMNYLKDKCVTEEVIKDRKIHPIHVFDDLCYEASYRTLVNGHRLYGVQGLLLTDYDGICLVKFEPQGSICKYKGVAIGSRSQSCRTILEDESENFDYFDLEGLITVGVKALKNAYPDSNELSADNVDIWCLEKDKKITKIDTEIYIK